MWRFHNRGRSSYTDHLTRIHFMVSHASWTRCEALCGVAALALLVAGGCGKKSRPPPLRSVAKLPAVSVTHPKEVEYRTQGGQAIAPVVVGDDPAPVVVAAQPSASPGQGGPATLNGDPNGLTRETLNQAVQGAMGSLASCFASLTQDPMVAVSFEADPSGRPSLLRVNGAPPDAERCIRNIVQGMRFPAFQGKGVQVDLPLSFHRVAQPAQPGGPSAGQQPGAAPLFLDP
jgi:hypothetical protein